MPNPNFKPATENNGCLPLLLASAALAQGCQGMKNMKIVYMVYGMRDQNCSAKALSACVQCTDRPLYLIL
jgi:hypothetical protein